METEGMVMVAVPHGEGMVMVAIPHGNRRNGDGGYTSWNQKER